MEQNSKSLSQNGVTPKKEGLFSRILWIFPLTIVFLGSKYLGSTIFLLIIPLYLGFIIPKWYLKKPVVNKKIIELVAWLNVIAWLYPIAGIFVCMSTFVFAEHFNKIRYWALASLGVIVTLIVAAVTIITKLS